MDPQLQELRAQIVEDINKHVTDVVTAAEHRLAEQARVNVEAVTAEARLAAEGYAGSLDSINAQLKDLRKDVGKQFSHYDAVLKNHNDRITSLEQKDF
jgi:hypothetical protein